MEKGEAADSFSYRFIKFKFNVIENKFKPVMFDILKTQEQILNELSIGLNKSDIPKLQEVYGPCQLEVPRKSIPKLLIDEVLNPFYIFQVFSVILWFWDGYTKYACCILFISVSSVIENLYETITNINTIRKMASYECDVEVKRLSITQI